MPFQWKRYTFHYYFQVKLASQVLSRTVSSAMGFCIKKKIIPEDFYGTHTLLALMDDLFDSFNGGATNCVTEKPKRRRLTATSDHHTFWDMAFGKLNKWKFISNGKISRPPCQEGILYFFFIKFSLSHGSLQLFSLK